MTGFTMRRVVPAVLAAGGLLLTACGTGDTASSAGTTTTTTTTTTVSATSATSATSAPSTSVTDTSTSDSVGGDLEPVDCGEVSLGTEVAYRLIAEPTDSGIAGCTEGFNVMDEFTKLSPEKRSEASLGTVTMASGWSCTMDDGERADLSCTKDGFALLAQQQAG